MPQVYKDILEFDVVAGSYNTEFLVEGDIIVPENDPDILTILAVNPRGYIEEVFVTSGKVQFEGKLNLELIYISEKDGEIETIEKEVDYSHSIEDEAIDKRSRCLARVSVENIDYRLVNSRKVNVKAVVRIQSRLLVSDKREVVIGGEEALALQTLKKRAKLVHTVGQNTGEVFVKEKVKVGDEDRPIKKVIKKEVKVVPEEVKLSENKVIVQGKVQCRILYVSEENEVKSLDATLNYANFIDVLGTLSYMKANTYEDVINVDVTVTQDEKGENRLVDVEVTLKVRVEVLEEEEREIPVDAYGIEKYVEPLKENIKVLGDIKSFSSQFMVKTEVELPSVVRKVLEIFALPIVSDYALDGDKLILEGILNYTLLYVSEDGGIKGYRDEYPFRTFVEIEGEVGEVLTEVSTAYVSYEINSLKELEFKFAIDSCVEVLTEKEMTLIYDLKEIEMPRGEEVPHSIIIYMVQKGESLWDIAKRYRVNVEDLITANDLKEDKVFEGEKLIIPVKR